MREEAATHFRSATYDLRAQPALTATGGRGFHVFPALAAPARAGLQVTSWATRVVHRPAPPTGRLHDGVLVDGCEPTSRSLPLSLLQSGLFASGRGRHLTLVLRPGERPGRGAGLWWAGAFSEASSGHVQEGGLRRSRTLAKLREPEVLQAQRPYELWLVQPQSERRKLLNLLLLNCTFDGETLRATYKKPFCWLAEGSLCSVWRG